MAINTGRDMFPGPNLMGMQPYLYMHPEIMEAIMSEPEQELTPFSNFKDRVFTEGREMANQMHGNALTVGKSLAIGSFLSSMGIGSSGNALFGGVTTSMLPLRSRMLLGATGALGDIQDFLKTTGNKGLSGKVYSYLKARGITQARATGYQNAAAHLGMDAPIAKPSLGPKTAPRPKPSTFRKALPWLVPSGTGLRAMLFWNIASGTLEENMGTWGGAVTEVAKYTAAAQVTNIAGKIASRKFGGPGGLLQTLQGSVKPIAMLDYERAVLARESRALVAAGSGDRGLWQTVKSSIMGKKDPSKAIDSARKVAGKWGAVSRGFGILGVGLRALNIGIGVTAGMKIAGQLVDYQTNLRGTFVREALSYETAFTNVPEVPAATSERQRAVQAIQNSSMNLRNFLGQEGAMMHS